MKVYHVRGARLSGVVFAETAEEAVARAFEQALVKPWDQPEAIEIPLPKGYRLIYDPLVGSMTQAELPLPLPEPEPEAAHTITRSGIKVYDNWQDNIVVDKDAPPLVWRANRDLFRTNTDVPGRSYLASENSEPALAWNLFRTLEKAGRLDVAGRALGLEDEFQVLYWGRLWDRAEPLPEIRQALRQFESRKGYQPEPDIILKGRRYLVMVEASLGKPEARMRAWERPGSLSGPGIYETPLRELLVDMSNWEDTLRRFHRLLRHLMMARTLARPEVWNLEPHLLAIVNQLNRHASLHSHAEEFSRFQGCLRWPPKAQMHLLTWQTLLARAEASFEPAFRPLLAHVKRLSYLTDQNNAY